MARTMEQGEGLCDKGGGEGGGGVTDPLTDSNATLVGFIVARTMEQGEGLCVTGGSYVAQWLEGVGFLLSLLFFLLLRSYGRALDPESGSVEEVGDRHQVFFGAPKLVRVDSIVARSMEQGEGLCVTGAAYHSLWVYLA